MEAEGIICRRKHPQIWFRWREHVLAYGAELVLAFLAIECGKEEGRFTSDVFGQLKDAIVTIRWLGWQASNHINSYWCGLLLPPLKGVAHCVTATQHVNTEKGRREILGVFPILPTKNFYKGVDGEISIWLCLNPNLLERRQATEIIHGKYYDIRIRCVENRCCTSKIWYAVVQVCKDSCICLFMFDAWKFFYLWDRTVRDKKGNTRFSDSASKNKCHTIGD